MHEFLKFLNKNIGWKKRIIKFQSIGTEDTKFILIDTFIKSFLFGQTLSPLSNLIL